MGLLERLRKIATPLPESMRRRLFRTVLSRFGGKLDMIASGGAALDPEVQLKWEQMGVAVVEGYGATECAPVVTITPRADRRTRSVGRPLPGQQVRIAEDSEVLTRGPNVLQRLLEERAATAAVSKANVQDRRPRLHRSGYLYLKGRRRTSSSSDGQTCTG